MSEGRRKRRRSPSLARFSRIAAPPRIGRDLFALGFGYRLQELAQGGLSKATRRKLQTMPKALGTNGRVGPAPSLSLKPGARLVREWGGRTHTVTITEDGFAGKTIPP
jgi:Protein of unknown function (DUF2924)